MPNPTADPIIPAPAPCPKCGGSGLTQVDSYGRTMPPGMIGYTRPCDCRAAGPAELVMNKVGGPKCNACGDCDPAFKCWDGSQPCYKQPLRDRFAAPPADRGRGETDDETILLERNQLSDELARVVDLLMAEEDLAKQLESERDAALREYERLRAKLRVMHFWAKCEPGNCNLDGGQEHAEYFAIGGAEWDQKTTR